MRFRYNFRNLPTFLRGQTMTLLYCNYLKLLSEAVAPRCSVKKVFLNISQNSQENTCARVSLLITLLNFVKRETLAQVSSFEICEISKNTFFYKTPLAAASILFFVEKIFFLLTPFFLLMPLFQGAFFYPSKVLLLRFIFPIFLLE